MKVWLIALACLVVGGAIGAGGTYVALSRHYNRHYNRMFESQHVIMALDQLNVLSHLRSGKAEELMKTIEEVLPQWAAGIPTLIENPQRANQVLWQVQHYYERFAIDVPETLQPILDALPPRPPTSCEIDLQQRLDNGS